MLKYIVYIYMFLEGLSLIKQVFIINGSGGVGKDSVCSAAAQSWQVQNISSITPILEVAKTAGWDGTKTPAARRFLSQLKADCTEFNDLPFRYCMEQFHAFEGNNAELLFVHIREPEEIARFRQAVGENCKAILVRRPALEQARGQLGNRSDDGVAAYHYDAEFINDGPLAELPGRVHDFLQQLIHE